MRIDDAAVWNMSSSRTVWLEQSARAVRQRRLAIAAHQNKTGGSSLLEQVVIAV
jgi:antibiotic biosynthesis monooxygenase (ABM) superfamily enzyme